MAGGPIFRATLIARIRQDVEGPDIGEFDEDVVAPLLMHSGDPGWRAATCRNRGQLLEIDLTAAAMSSASARVGATHIATISPT